MPGTLPDFRGMSVGRAIEVARAAGIAVELVGTGRVVEQDPPPGAPSARATLRFSDGASRAAPP